MHRQQKWMESLLLFQIKGITTSHKTTESLQLVTLHFLLIHYNFFLAFMNSPSLTAHRHALQQYIYKLRQPLLNMICEHRQAQPRARITATRSRSFHIFTFHFTAEQDDFLIILIYYAFALSSSTRGPW